MEILKQLEAKTKTEKVIESCVTISQLDAARNYLEIYSIKYEDGLGYYQLLGLLNEKLENIKV
tara:strand:- start:699 stop:887 length:189 start_codon:yes stop_codon:yes gene_type:complete